jgi:hypothetical protein
MGGIIRIVAVQPKRLAAAVLLLASTLAFVTADADAASTIGSHTTHRSLRRLQDGIIPAACEGMNQNKVQDCIDEQALIASILEQNDLEDLPADCEGQKSDKVAQCLQDWRLTQIVLGLSKERIPPECEEFRIEGKEDKMDKCLQQYTLSPTSHPTYSPTMMPQTYSPTVWSTYGPTASPIRWSWFAAQIKNPDATYEEIYTMIERPLSIGRYSMSVTRYGLDKKNRNRVLKNDDGNNVRQWELDATREHLLEVYEAEFHIPVEQVDLHFLDGGETMIGVNSDGIIRHSTFYGNVVFDNDSVNATKHPRPTLEQLEQVTLAAFAGEQKEAFLEKYHLFSTGRPYLGVKYTYDVNVRNNIENIEGPNSAAADQEVMTLGARFRQWSSSVGPTSTVFIVLMILAVVLLGTLIGLTAFVVRRKKRGNGVKSSSRDTSDGLIDDEPDALGSVISEIESGSMYSCAQSLSNVQPNPLDEFKDCVSNLATSSDDSGVSKDTEKVSKEMDNSKDSTKEADSGDSDSTWSFSVKSVGSGTGSEMASNVESR